MRKSNVKIKGKLRTYLYLPLLLTMLLIIINVFVYMEDTSSGVLFSGFVLLYFVIMLIAYLRNKPLLIDELINFATQYGLVQKQLLNEFEIPYALVDYNAKFLWVNEQFTEVTGKDKKYHKSVMTVFPTLTKELLQRSEPVESINLTYNDRYYRVALKRIYFDAMTHDSTIVSLDESNEYLTAMYLFDETELNRYIRENEEQRLVAGLVYIDNYDEALDSIEDVKRSLLVALIDRKVNKYFTEIDALVRKIENDKYFVVFKNQYLGKLREDRFSIIEDVKTVKVGNEMAVTLSIGIGVGGDSYTKNYEYARMAIDLALGRGGDQVVVRDNEDVTYYGGKTNKQVERNNRVKARVKAHALKEFMSSKDKIVVMGHKITDVDSFGAAIGIYRAARTLEKKAYIVINNPTSSIRPLMDGFLHSQDYDSRMFVTSHEAKEIVDDNTVVVVVDTNRPSYTECEDLLYMTKTIVVLDHHRQNKDIIQNAVLSYIEPYASSACEMVAEILQYFADGLKLRSIEADCIYAGIMIDTNNFTTRAGVRTFEAAAFLRRCGADVTRVRKMLRDNIDSYKARAEAVRTAEIYRDYFAIARCPSEGLESPTVVGAQAANELLNIAGVKASFVLTSYNNEVYISARAIDEVNVQVMMERMGGGGHLNIAGAQVKDTMDETERMLKEIIDQLYQEGDK